ncbi:MAG TPA: hypothetical protein DIW23_15390 [Anaerolineae bacterium]|nr:hypothetical protein [Anaerolineae bacterium]HRJ74457.1 hypothetical protein [Anaerolineales bacterium]
MTTHRHFKYEGWLYVLAFLIAFGIRITQLGALPLNDAEATSALQALQISQSENTALSPHPFYILSTSVLFLMYGGGTDFLARFMPALIGSLLVFAPLLFDNRLKPRPSLLLAFFIALDPGFVAISRQAASPIFAITFFVFTLGFINKNKLTLASAFAALTLLSGPSLWLGLIGLLISWMIFQVFNRNSFHFTFSDSSTRNSFLITFLITFFTAGTLFLTVPNGLSAAFASLPEFFKSFTNTSETTWGMILISILIYQPLAFILALFAIVRGILNNIKKIIFLTIWMLVALLLVIFLPARQITDLVWVLIPLNALAALELARAFNIFPEERSEIAGVTFLTVFIWVFAWLGFAGMTWFPADSREYGLRFWMLLGSLVLLALSLLLVAAGWSARTARIGGVWGFVIALGALTLGGTFGAAGLRGQNAPELWWQPSIPAQAHLLRETAQQVSEFYTGDDNSASVVIAGLDSPALAWALREHDVQIVETLDATTAPDIVITRFENNPALMAAYRGQDFNWRQTYLWHVSPFDVWVRWITLREISYAGESIILWARDDLFVDK